MDLLVSSDEIRAIEQMFRAKGARDWERDIRQLASARKEMAQSSRDYMWAFQQFSDVMCLLAYKHGGWLKAYPHPHNIAEFAVDALHQRFPFDQTAQFDILVLHGDSVWTDWRYGPGPQAGSIATEAQWLINPSDWWLYAGYDFDQCLNLIRVTHNSPCYRPDEGICIQIWEDTLRHHRATPSDVWYGRGKLLDAVAVTTCKQLGTQICNLYSLE